MKMAISRVLRAIVGASAVAVLLAAGVAHSTGTRQIDRPAGLAQTASEEAFADADYDVDPMVTGPTSASFKQKQATAGCNEAVWPHISLDCYPDR